MSVVDEGIAEYLLSKIEKLRYSRDVVASIFAKGIKVGFEALDEDAKLLLDSDADLTPLVDKLEAIWPSEPTLAKISVAGNTLDNPFFENKQDRIKRFLDEWRSEAVKDRPYYLSLPVWPNFAAPNNKVDGLLPTCRVLGWDHFVQVMRDPSQNRTKREIVYRGQRGFDWPLASTLSRLFSDTGIPHTERQEFLNFFRLAMRGRGPDLTLLSDEEVWAYGQHVGLATPLLDWSKSPFVSLYFAFSEPDQEGKLNDSRSIFCLDMTRIKAVLEDLFVEPKSNDNARLVNQAGLFTITPSGKENFESYLMNALQYHSAVDFDGFEDLPTGEDTFNFPISETASKLSSYICKIHIPNVGRDACLGMLRKMNIHYGSLFPDPFGAAQHSNDWLRRKIHEESEDRRKEEELKKTQKEELSDNIRMEKDDIIEENVEEALKLASGSSLEELVRGVILKNTSRIEPDFDAERWTNIIIQNYKKQESVDWVLKESARARIKTQISRQLSLLGANSSSSIKISNELLKIFEEYYRKGNSVDFNKSTRKIEYDFFAGARKPSDTD